MVMRRKEDAVGNDEKTSALDRTADDEDCLFGTNNGGTRRAYVACGAGVNDFKRMWRETQPQTKTDFRMRYVRELAVLILGGMEVWVGAARDFLPGLHLFSLEGSLRDMASVYGEHVRDE